MLLNGDKNTYVIKLIFLYFYRTDIEYGTVSGALNKISNIKLITGIFLKSWEGRIQRI